MTKTFCLLALIRFYSFWYCFIFWCIWCGGF